MSLLASLAEDEQEVDWNGERTALSKNLLYALLKGFAAKRVSEQARNISNETIKGRTVPCARCLIGIFINFAPDGEQN